MDTTKDIGQAKHDIKNSLANIKLLVQLLHRHADSPEATETKTILEKIDAKINELTKQINEL